MSERKPLGICRNSQVLHAEGPDCREFHIVEPPSPSQPVTAEPDYSAWLIERADKPQQFLIYHNGAFDWTDNADRSVHFSRRDDAEQIAEVLENEDIKITEHLWPNLSTLKSAQPVTAPTPEEKHPIDDLAQKIIDANPGCQLTAAYRQAGIDHTASLEARHAALAATLREVEQTLNRRKHRYYGMTSQEVMALLSRIRTNTNSPKENTKE